MLIAPLLSCSPSRRRSAAVGLPSSSSGRGRHRTRQVPLFCSNSLLGGPDGMEVIWIGSLPLMVGPSCNALAKFSGLLLATLAVRKCIASGVGRHSHETRCCAFAGAFGCFLC